MALVESDFLRGSSHKGELVNVKRYTVELTGHHSDRDSALELILSVRGNIGKLLAPEGSCVSAIVALRMLDTSLQIFRHGYGNRIGGGMRYVHPVGHRDMNRHVVFGVDDVEDASNDKDWLAQASGGGDCADRSKSVSPSSR